MKKKVLVVFGTRPEAIKMAPVVRALKNEPDIDVKVCVTAQHRSMLDQVLSLFDIVPDFDLNLMSTSQTLDTISARILEAVSRVLDSEGPNLVLVHGDTITTSMASLACFYKRIPVAHVEAGLRTGNLYAPWPEELNRRITGLVAQLHFAPTSVAHGNLVSEGVAPTTVEVTGNTVVDALLEISEKLKHEKNIRIPLDERFAFLSNEKKLILVTGHRRENFGEGMTEICAALLALSSRPDVQIVYAVHLNPNVKEIIEDKLGGQENIYLIPPQDYLSFVYLMMKSHIILTDSGGIQEEAPSLGKPVLVMRNTTERPEAVQAGTARLVGANSKLIIRGVERLLDEHPEYLQMSKLANPYGDGQAATRISKKVVKFLDDGK
jgi:UDP-N-acetylglucosamine 2-epimerase (non-hydrolysing)